MGENSGFNTAEKGISGVENRSEDIIQNAAQKEREISSLENRYKRHGRREEKAQQYFLLDFQICKRKSRTEIIFEKVIG